MDILINNFILTIKELSKSESQASISTRIGLQPQSLSHIMTGKRKPTITNLSKLHIVYGVNINWIITGVGSAYSKEKLKRKSTTGLPLVTGFVHNQSFEFDDSQIIDKYVLPYYDDADFIYLVSTDFFEPKYRKGDMLICKKCKLDDVLSTNREIKETFCNFSGIQYLSNLYSDLYNNDYLIMVAAHLKMPIQVKIKNFGDVSEILGVLKPTLRQFAPNVEKQ